MEGLKSFTSCEISDALFDLGIASGGLLTGMHAFSPEPRNLMKPIIGPVYTVKMVSLDDTTSPYLAKHHVDTCPPGSILVTQAPPRSRSSTWGGLMSTAAKSKGIKAVVVDGGCRDIAEHLEMGFPVFARHHTTLSAKQSMRPSEVGVPLTIRPSPAESELHAPYPDILVRQEDVIICDLDGCVIIPQERLDEVVKRAGEMKVHSDRILHELANGTGVDAANEKWRKH